MLSDLYGSEDVFNSVGSATQFVVRRFTTI